MREAAPCDALARAGRGRGVGSGEFARRRQGLRAELRVELGEDERHAERRSRERAPRGEVRRERAVSGAVVAAPRRRRLLGRNGRRVVHAVGAQIRFLEVGLQRPERRRAGAVVGVTPQNGRGARRASEPEQGGRERSAPYDEPRAAFAQGDVERAERGAHVSRAARRPGVAPAELVVDDAYGHDLAVTRRLREGGLIG